MEHHWHSQHCCGAVLQLSVTMHEYWLLSLVYMYSTSSTCNMACPKTQLHVFKALVAWKLVKTIFVKELVDGLCEKITGSYWGSWRAAWEVLSLHQIQMDKVRTILVVCEITVWGQRITLWVESFYVAIIVPSQCESSS